MGNLYGLIGYPTSHSMSPIMHNQAFASLHLPHHYQAFSVHPQQLAAAISGIKALGVSGFNVTIPHKVTVMDYLDEIDELAANIGAVNTVKNVDGKLIGYNTDGAGFLLSLKQLHSAPLVEKSVLIIGAGGAARAILATLLHEGIKTVDIANRTVSKAEALVTRSGNTSSRVFSLTEAAQLLGKYDIIVNTTSVGMSPHVDELPVSVENVSKGAVLCDIIYNPLETNWLKAGKVQGAITQNGIGMFVGQGALAFELWTNQKPNFEQMEQTVLNQLGGKTC